MTARLARPLAAAVAAVAAAWPLAQTAVAGPEEPVVPAKLAVEDGNKLYLVGHAVGVQIYACNAGASGLSWGLVAPRANLYGDNGQLITTHFGGPTWQARDGSAVVGRRLQDVSVDPTAIPWLLIGAAATSPGEDGDRLTGTTFIQRIATVGGLAPAAAECNVSTVGTQREVPYTADYTFWKATGA